MSFGRVNAKYLLFSRRQFEFQFAVYVRCTAFYTQRNLRKNNEFTKRTKLTKIIVMYVHTLSGKQGNVKRERIRNFKTRMSRFLEVLT